MDSFYHRHIHILNNRFNDNHGRMLSADWTDDLLFSGHHWSEDHSYDSQMPGKAVVLTHCGQTILKDNVLPPGNEK